MTWVAIAAFLESPLASMGYALLVVLLLYFARSRLRSNSPVELARPISVSLGVLFGLRLIELIIFAAAWSGLPTSIRLMPPLERSIHIFTILAFGWLWAQFIEHKRNLSAYFAFALMAVLVIAIGLMVIWLGSPVASFNYTDLDYVWTGACVIALYLGWFHVVRGKRSGQGAEGWRSFIRWKTNGSIVFALLLFGQLIHLLLAEPFGNMPLATELASLLALPILFGLSSVAAGQEAPTDEVTRDAASKPAEQKFEEFPDSFHPDAAQLARTLAEDYRADACAFVYAQEGQDELTLEVGYNLLRDVSIEPSMIESDQVPKLWQALQDDRSLRLSSAAYLPELGILAEALRLSFHANLLATSLDRVSSISYWGVVLLRGKETWQVDDEVKLETQAAEISQVLAALASATSEPIRPLSKTETSAIEEGTAEKEGLENGLQELDWLFSPEDATQAESDSNNGQGSTQGDEVIEQLYEENKHLKSAFFSLQEASEVPGTVSIEAQQAKEELKLALEEVAVLHARLDTAQKMAALSQAEDTAQAFGKKMAENQAEVVADIAEELRQPLSSVLGYTQLLLGESVGLLGALQRKFLERVQSSTERMNSLIGDLIRIAELEQTGHGAVRKSVDLGAVIDDAVGQLRPQIDKKSIKVNVDLPKRIAELNADRDALQQIVFHLLQNANAATPLEGTISLRAVTDAQPEYGDYLLLQVTDGGGGIPNEYLPGLFSRVYRATNPIIPGVGDTGVGLTIAETLTKALGGRIWVDSEMGKGATFSVLLPLTGKAAGEAANITKTLNEI